MVKKFFSIVCSIFLFVSPIFATYNPNSGQSATPGSIFYTPSQGANGGVLSQQTKNQQTTFITEWKNSNNVLPVCNDSTTNNSQSLVNAMNAANIVYLPSNCILAIDNVSIPSNTLIICNNHSNNSGFIHLSSGTTTSMFKVNTGSFFAGIIGCTINGNSVNSSSPLININQSSSITIQDDVFRFAGSTGNLVRDIQVFQSSVTIQKNTVGDGPTGTFAFVDMGGSTNRIVRIQNNDITGPQDNAIVMENSGGSSNSKPGYCFIEGNNIRNITDAFNGTGQFGNGILLYQIWNCEVAHNIIDNTQWSGIRVGENTAFNDVHDNQIWFSRDNFYCSEEGGFGNRCHDNQLYASAGFSSTNQSLRLIGIPDQIYNNTCYGGTNWCGHFEGAIAHDNWAINTPLGFQLGAGSTTGGNKFYRNGCVSNQLTGSGGTPVSGLFLGQPMATCVTIDAGTSSSFTEILEDNFLGSGWQIPIGIVGSNNNIGVTNITKANPAVVTISGTDSAITVGAKLCLLGIQGMTQANGQCPTVIAISGNNITVAMDSTTYTTYDSNTTGLYPSAWVYWTSSGTPVSTFGNTYLLKNMEIPFSMLSGMKQGSHVWVYDAGCNLGSPVASGTGIWVDKVSSSLFVCVLNTDGTVNSPVGLNSGGSATGQVLLKESTGGHTLTVKPTNGLASDTTVTLPQ